MTSNNNQNSPLTYWAADPDSRVCADEIIDRCHDYWTALLKNGWFDTWRRLYYSYNANRYTLAQTVQAGENAEYRTIKVNHFRNILEHIQNLSITDRPAWEPVSTNTDSRSQKQTIIARGILDYYMREKDVPQHLRNAVTNALLFTEGFVSVLWDEGKGKAIARDPETGQIRYEGDVKYQAHEPVDVIRDPNLKAFNQRDWVVVRTYENKYNLAEKYPEYREEIVNQSSALTPDNHYLGGQFIDRSFITDTIPVLTFYHSRTAACPEGRQMTLLLDGTVLTDSKVLLYKHIPIHRIVPNEQIGTPMGMSVSLDLLPLQQMVDAHYTTLLSINENYGIPKILLPIGSEIDTASVSSGFQTISYNPDSGKPEVMNMPMAPEGYYKALELLQGAMETISAVNSVSRGQPQASLESGSALALVQSMAIQFYGPLQQSYVFMLEGIGTATINILQDYADTERMIQIAGKRQKGIIQQSFSNKDLDIIERVSVQVGNPMSKTVSGRLSIAQDLIKNKIISTYQEYLMVLETGELDPLVQGDYIEMLNLSQENEMLLDGEMVLAMITDNHVLHIKEHSAIAGDPNVRTDPERIKVLSDHIQQHLQMLTDPAYQNYRKIMEYPDLPPPGQAPQGQPGMPPPGMNGPGPGATQMSAAGNNGVNQGMGNQQIVQQAQDVNMPNSPQNPLTGQRPNLPQSPA